MGYTPSYMRPLVHWLSRSTAEHHSHNIQHRRPPAPLLRTCATWSFGFSSVKAVTTSFSLQVVDHFSPTRERCNDANRNPTDERLQTRSALVRPSSSRARSLSSCFLLFLQSFKHLWSAPSSSILRTDLNVACCCEGEGRFLSFIDNSYSLVHCRQYMIGTSPPSIFAPVFSLVDHCFCVL